MIAPSFPIIMFFWLSLHVSKILRSQQVFVGEAGRLAVYVAFAGPVVLYTAGLMISPVETEVPDMMRAKTSKAVSG